MGFKAVSFNNINKNKFGSKKTTSIKTEKFDGKDRKEDLVIEGTPAQTNYMEHHLEKEHPSTKGRMHIEKPDYYKHSSGEYQNRNEVSKTLKNEDVAHDFLNGRNSKTKTMTSKDGKLYSYDTVIAEKKDGKIYVTDKKYSTTTSKHLHELNKALEMSGHDDKVVKGFEEPKENNPKENETKNEHFHIEKTDSFTSQRGEHYEGGYAIKDKYGNIFSINKDKNVAEKDLEKANNNFTKENNPERGINITKDKGDSLKGYPEYKYEYSTKDSDYYLDKNTHEWKAQRINGSIENVKSAVPPERQSKENWE